MIKHNSCFPCYHYRNHRNEYLYCAKGHVGQYEAFPTLRGWFGRPEKCKDWSPEQGCDYEPETRESVAIEEVKAAIKRFEEGK